MPTDAQKCNCGFELNPTIGAPVLAKKCPQQNGKHLVVVRRCKVVVKEELITLHEKSTKGASLTKMEMKRRITRWYCTRGT